MKLTKQCLNCQLDYTAEERYLKRGQGLFCSRKCAAIYKHTQAPAQEPNTTCSWCGTTFYKTDSSKSQSKSGLFFCSRNHKDLAQRIGGIKEIQPSHYSDSIKDYRDKAFREYDKKCIRCGWDKIPEVLEVNHIDCNRLNNELSNLEILCPTCHRAYHFETKTGYWK